MSYSPRSYALYRRHRRRRRLKRLALVALLLAGIYWIGSSLGGDGSDASVALVSAEEDDQATSPPPALEPVLDEFGIPTGAFRTSERPIRRNETFAQILADYDIPYGDAVTLASLSEPVMDVRRIQAGKSLRLYQDSSSAVHYLVYEQDPVRYVVFDLKDSLSVYAKAREVDVRERLVGGAIDGLTL